MTEELKQLPLADRLRFTALEIRRKPFPISDIIPLLNQAADEIARRPAAQDACTHVPYTTQDTDRPNVVCDRNGEVVLAMCKLCGKAEEELTAPHIVPREWRNALRKLSFMAQTSGGTAAPDNGLQEAINEAAVLLAKPYVYARPVSGDSARTSLSDLPFPAHSVEQIAKMANAHSREGDKALVREMLRNYAALVS